MIDTIDNLQQGPSTKVLIGNDTSLAWDISSLVTPDDILHSKFFVVGTYTRTPIVPTITDNPLTATFFIDSSITTEVGSYNIDIEVFNSPQQYSDKRYVLSEAFVVVSSEFELTSGSESASQSELENKINAHVNNANIHITEEEKQLVAKIKTATNIEAGLVKGSEEKNKASVSENGELEVNSLDWEKLNNIPTAFIPAAHKHNVDDINNFVEEVKRIEVNKAILARHSETTDKLKTPILIGDQVIEEGDVAQERFSFDGSKGFYLHEIGAVSLTQHQTDTTRIEGKADDALNKVNQLDSRLDHLQEGVIEIIGDSNQHTGALKEDTTSLDAILNSWIDNDPAVEREVRKNLSVIDVDGGIWRLEQFSPQPTTPITYIGEWQLIGGDSVPELAISALNVQPFANINTAGQTVGQVKEAMKTIASQQSSKQNFIITIKNAVPLVSNWGIDSFVCSDTDPNTSTFSIYNNTGTTFHIDIFVPRDNNNRLYSRYWAVCLNGVLGDIVTYTSAEAIASHNTDREAHKSIRDEIAGLPTYQDLQEELNPLATGISANTSAIGNLNERVEALNGAAILIGKINQFTSAITNQLLNNRAIELKGNVKVGYTLVDSDSTEWWCEDSAGQDEGAISGRVSQWNNIGQNVIGTATNDNPGVVQGSGDTDKVGVNALGQMVLNLVSTAKLIGNLSISRITGWFTRNLRIGGTDYSFMSSVNGDTVDVDELITDSINDKATVIVQAHNESEDAHSDIRAKLSTVTELSSNGLLWIGLVQQHSPAVTDSALNAILQNWVSEINDPRANLVITDLDGSMWRTKSILGLSPVTADWEWTSRVSDSATTANYATQAASTPRLTVNNDNTNKEQGLKMLQRFNDADNPSLGAWYSTLRLQHGGYDTGYWQELAMSFSSDHPWVRRNNNGEYSAWRKLAMDDEKAPTNHVSSDSTYGVGNSSYYGHLKLADSVNNTQTSSSGTATTPKAVYDEINALNTASENILPNSWKGTGLWDISPQNTDPDGAVVYATENTNFSYVDLGYYTISGGTTEGQSYIYSFWARTTTPAADSFHVYLHNTSTSLQVESSQGYMATNSDGYAPFTLSTVWTQYWVRWTESQNTSQKTIILGRLIGNRSIVGVRNVFIKKPMFSQGNVPQQWQPNNVEAKGIGSWTIEEVDGNLQFKYGGVTKQILLSTGDIQATIF